LNIAEFQADQLVDVMPVIFISQQFGIRPSGPPSCPFKSGMRGSAIESHFSTLGKGTCNIGLNPERASFCTNRNNLPVFQRFHSPIIFTPPSHTNKIQFTNLAVISLLSSAAVAQDWQAAVVAAEALASQYASEISRRQSWEDFANAPEAATSAAVISAQALASGYKAQYGNRALKVVINQSSLPPPRTRIQSPARQRIMVQRFASHYTSEASPVVLSALGVASSATEGASSIASSAQSVASTVADSATREASPIVSSAMSFAGTAGGSEGSSAVSIRVLRPWSFLQPFPQELDSTFRSCLCISKNYLIIASARNLSSIKQYRL
jgi:hypothetical protein